VPVEVTTRLVKFATPLLSVTVVVLPELKLDCGLPDLMDITTDPKAVVTTLPFVSSTDTATPGMALPCTPGPGIAGVKAILLAVPATIETADDAGAAVSELPPAVRV
jgi:hypothetical protein